MSWNLSHPTLLLALDPSLIPPYLLGLVGVLGGIVSILKWRSDTDDQEEKRKNEATRQAFEAYQATIGQLEKRVDAAEANARQANDRATLADQRFLALEDDHRQCERRNLELNAMIELMRTILNDRGIHIPALGTRGDHTQSVPHSPDGSPRSPASPPFDQPRPSA